MPVIVVFAALSVALLLLAILLLWFVPHLIQQQEQRAAREARQLREVLSDMLGEQEAVALRQAQFGSSLSYLQDQIEQLSSSWPSTIDELMAPDHGSQRMLSDLNERILSLQQHLGVWAQQRSRGEQVSARDTESWINLMSLLSTMQDRLGELERSRQRIAQLQASAISQFQNISHASQPINEAELEQRLHEIADDLVTLRWRLQRSSQAQAERQQPLDTLPPTRPGLHARRAS